MQVSLDLSPLLTLSRTDFQTLCAANPDRKLERTAQGNLIVMAPTGGETGYRNFSLLGQLYLWTSRHPQAGIAFDSSTGFALLLGGDRSPDLSWITLEKWQALTPEQRRGFLPLCPDFAVELLSPSDSWHQGQLKMEEYRDNGCRLGWLLDPKSGRVAIYRPDRPVEILQAPTTLSGEEVLPGFVLEVAFLWEN
jgi:Uma2 family endonuclease